MGLYPLGRHEAVLEVVFRKPVAATWIAVDLGGFKKQYLNRDDTGNHEW